MPGRAGRGVSSLAQLNWFGKDMSAGRGYMALAACIFRLESHWGLGASFLFSFTDAIQMRMRQLRSASVEIIQMIPYLLTILILRSSGQSRPAALGKHYEAGQARCG